MDFRKRSRYNSNSNINSGMTEDIDEFTSDKLEDILDIYDELKYRFPYNFLENLRSTHLTSFIIDYLFLPNNLYMYKVKENYHYKCFINFYKYELQLSYSIVLKIFKQYKSDFTYSYWCNFCYRFSNPNYQ